MMMVDVVHTHQHPQPHQQSHPLPQDSSLWPSMSLPKRSHSLGIGTGMPPALTSRPPDAAEAVDAEGEGEGELELPMLPNAISTPQLHAQLHPHFLSPAMQDNYHMPHSVFSPTPKLQQQQQQQQQQQPPQQQSQPHAWSMADAAANNASQLQQAQPQLHQLRSTPLHMLSPAPLSFFPLQSSAHAPMPTQLPPPPSSSGPSIAAMFEQQQLLQQQQQQQWQQQSQPQPPQPRPSLIISPAPLVSQHQRRQALRRSGAARSSVSQQRLRTFVEAGNNSVKQEQQPQLAVSSSLLLSPLSTPSQLLLVQQQQQPQAAELQLRHEITLQAQHLRQVQQQRLELEMLRVAQLQQLQSLHHAEQGLHTQMVVALPPSVPATTAPTTAPLPATALPPPLSTPMPLPMPNQVDEYIQALSADQFDLLIQRRRHLQQQQQAQQPLQHPYPPSCLSLVPLPLSLPSVSFFGVAVPPPSSGAACR
jgi:hypothetical protein